MIQLLSFVGNPSQLLEYLNFYKYVEKDEDYYLNQCSGATKFKEELTIYGRNEFYKVEDKIVEIQELCYSDGFDDFYEELNKVIIHDNK